MDITTIAQDVRALMASEGVELPEDVGMAERVVRERMLALGQRVLQGHFEGRKLGYEGSSRACGCGESQKFVSHREKHVMTLLGEVSMKRSYYHCRHCGASCVPYDQEAGLSSCAASPGLARAACLAGIQVPFGQGAKLLEELSGIGLSESTVGRLTERVGREADARERNEAKRKETWQSPPEAQQAGRLYNSADGTMLHTLEQWQEVKTQVCYWKDADQRHHARYCARLEGIDEFVGHAWALSSRWGLENCRQSVLIGDGAAWIWDRLGPVFDESVQIVDWYHALEHVWSCARALHEEGSESCGQWVKAKETLLYNGQWAKVVEELAKEYGGVRAKGKRAALRGLMTYLNNQASRLEYQKFRDQGLDIGSGTVESACRHVVQSRMKRAGTRWSKAGAQAVLSLRCCWINEQWERFWDSHPLAA